jgi:hypothetical protein
MAGTSKRKRLTPKQSREIALSAVSKPEPLRDSFDASPGYTNCCPCDRLREMQALLEELNERVQLCGVAIGDNLAKRVREVLK